MIRDIVETFRKPSATQLAQRELEESQRQLLECQKLQAYYQKMAEFYKQRINDTQSVVKRASEGDAA